MPPGKDDGWEVNDLTFVAYNRGAYEVAYAGLRHVVDEHPDALGSLFSVLYTCERVIAARPDVADLPYLNRSVVLPTSIWNRARLRLGLAGDIGPTRCKWCGHYTPWVDPNDDFNRCRRCSEKYPSPNWFWDTRMSHSEGRGSWAPNSAASRIWHEMCDRYEAESGERLDP